MQYQTNSINYNIQGEVPTALVNFPCTRVLNLMCNSCNFPHVQGTGHISKLNRINSVTVYKTFFLFYFLSKINVIQQTSNS